MFIANQEVMIKRLIEIEFPEDCQEEVTNILMKSIVNNTPIIDNITVSKLYASGFTADNIVNQIVGRFKETLDIIKEDIVQGL
jgi:hypothetical protein